jgi:hypothetical protein
VALSAGGISHPDNTYLGGEFPQFNEVAIISLFDETFSKRIGIFYSHISSMGWAGTNQGRDFISMIVGYQF